MLKKGRCRSRAASVNIFQSSEREAEQVVRDPEREAEQVVRNTWHSSDRRRLVSRLPGGAWEAMTWVARLEYLDRASAEEKKKTEL
jgi:hypothetical protein